ncbi:MAG TPA: hypothetical protein ENK18_01130 [Deltaproteobacteria bacterium]|nr:hypothetical protein [Deltaproteobacteria bacterium]
MQRVWNPGSPQRSTARALGVGLLLSALAAGCEEEPQRTNLPTWSPTTDTATGTDPGNPQVLGEFRIALPIDLNYPARMYAAGTEDDPCSVKPDGTPEGYVDLDCIIDVPELDLYALGMSWDWFIPAGACEFAIYSHYMYETWEWGFGENNVLVEIVDGNIVNEVNAINGVPYCAYNYSPIGPDCCTGAYTYTRIIDGVTTVSQQLWGGTDNLGACHGGAAYHDSEAVFGPGGFPIDKIVYLQRSAWSKHFEFDGLNEDYFTNVPLANHYSPADHGGGPPAGLQRTRQNGLGFAQSTYDFECHDHAQEIRAKIRLRIREFNTEAAYFNDGDPDVEGFEPVTGDPLNDRLDWKDLTPGPDLYPLYFE